MNPVVGNLIEPSAIQRILVCRINERLGNNVLLTPLLANLAQLMPHCKIDLLLSRPIYTELLTPLTGVDQTFTFPREYYRAPLKILRLTRQLRAQRYDLAIDPGCISGSGRLCMLLSGAKIKLGFSTSHKRYEVTHTILPSSDLPHDSHRPLELLKKFNIQSQQNYQQQLQLNLSDAEREHGKQVLNSTQDIDNAKPIIAVFCDAAGEKKIAATWWQRLVKYLKENFADYNIVEIISAKQTAAINPDIPGIRQSKLRDLASVFSQLNFYISADTGPMHLAAASGVPTIGLFNASNPKQFAPQGESDLAINMNHLDNDAVFNKISQHILHIKNNIVSCSNECFL